MPCCWTGILLIVTEVVAQIELQNFLLDNGHRHVDIFFNHSSNDCLQLMPRNAYSSLIHIDKINEANTNGFGIFLFDPEKDDALTYLTHITQRRVKMTLLVIARPTNLLDMLPDLLSSIEATGFFYVAILSNRSKVMSWNQILSLKTGTAVNRLTFAANSSKIIERFDLQNLTVRSTSLTWTPYLVIDDCNEFGLECKKNYGYLIDYMDLLAGRYNFTYISQKNIDNDWGALPKSGPFNISGTWGGVMGDVIHKKYDLSLSDWFWDNERNELLQFVGTNMNSVVLVMKPHYSEVDFGLFTRAFAEKSWIGIVLTVTAATSCVLLSNVLISDEKSQGPKMLTFMSMVFFVLANAYYCGVLTMFFSYPAAKVFDTERQAMQAYPEWKLFFLKGWETNVYRFVTQGIPEYVNYWKRYKDNPTGSTFDSIKEGLELVDGNNIIMINELQLLSHLKINPTKQRFHVFGQHNIGHRCLLFHRNSPLVPMFKQGVSHFREKGIEHELLTKWFGKWKKNDDTLDGNTLTLGQMMLVFILMAVVYALCLTFLCGEIMFHWFKKTNLASHDAGTSRELNVRHRVTGQASSPQVDRS